MYYRHDYLPNFLSSTVVTKYYMLNNHTKLQYNVYTNYMKLLSDIYINIKYWTIIPKDNIIDSIHNVKREQEERDRRGVS